MSIDAKGGLISNVATPVASTDAANKAYVDAASQGLTVRASVRVLASSTVAALTGSPVTIDGVSVSAGTRVLLTAQTTGSQNGIWVVQTGAWTRPSDFAAGQAAAGAFCFVQDGNTYADQGWVCTTNSGADVVDTNALSWTQFTGLGEVSAGNGLSKNVNALAVALATNSGLQFTGGLLDQLLVTGGGLSKNASGLQVLVNPTPSTLAADASGLRVTGLPGLFLVAGAAVDANVTAANLNTLVDGTASYADALHNHSTVAGALNLQGPATNSAVSGINAGDPVCWGSTANTLARADCAADATSRVIGIAAGSIATNATGTIVREGVVVGVLSGATPGAPYWLASGGGLTAACPTASGSRVIRVGFAKNATDLEVRVADMGKRA